MIKLFFLVVFTILFYFFVACAKLMSMATNTVANSCNSISAISGIHSKPTLADNIFLEIFNIIRERKICPYFYQNTIVEFVMVVEVYFLFMYIHLTKMGINAYYDGTYRILPIKEFAKKKGISYFPRKINKGRDLCAYDFYTLENLIECFEDRCDSYSKVKALSEICDVDDKYQKANMEFIDSIRYVSEIASLLKENILNSYGMHSEICDDIASQDSALYVDLFIEIEKLASMFAQVISSTAVNIVDKTRGVR